MKLRPHERLLFPEAKRRALSALRTEDPQPASAIADAIWPGNQMKAQGAGAAASRVLKSLERDGLAMWCFRGTHPFQRWGWVKAETAAAYHGDIDGDSNYW